MFDFPKFSLVDASQKLRRLNRMFEKIDSFCWQRYLDWPEIENWSDESSRIVLIGEASRPLIVSPPFIGIPRLFL